MPMACARALAGCWGCLLRTITMQQAPVMSAVRTTWALVSPVRSAKSSWSTARTSLRRSLAANPFTVRSNWSAPQTSSPVRTSRTSPTVIMCCLLSCGLPATGSVWRRGGGEGVSFRWWRRKGNRWLSHRASRFRRMPPSSEQRMRCVWRIDKRRCQTCGNCLARIAEPPGVRRNQDLVHDKGPSAISCSSELMRKARRTSVHDALQMHPYVMTPVPVCVNPARGKKPSSGRWNLAVRSEVRRRGGGRECSPGTGHLRH